MIVNLKTELLLSYCDPFGRNVWGNPISREEVLLALSQNRLVSDFEDKSDPAGRVAYLVVHKAEDPVEIDVGEPGTFAEWFITDGNHRFAAALLRGDEEILCRISGCPEYIEHFFGLDRLGTMPVQPAKQP